MPETSLNQSEARPATRPRRRAGVLLLIGLAFVGAIFHRPILLWGMQVGLARAARLGDVELSWQLSGSLWSNLEIRNLHAVGGANSPIKDFRLEALHADYDLRALLRRRPMECLKAYSIRNASIDIRRIQRPKRPGAVGRIFADTFGHTARFGADRIRVENFSVTAETPVGEDFALRGLDLRIEPGTEGVLRIAELHIPRFQHWKNLHGTTRQSNRDLVVTGVDLDDRVRVERLRFDATRRAEGVNRIEADLALFGGKASLAVRREAGSGKVDVTLSGSGVPIEPLQAYFHVPAAVKGTATVFSLQGSGNPDSPQSWTGRASISAAEGAIASIPFATGSARLNAKGGVASVETLEFLSGSNRVHLEGQAPLPAVHEYGGFRFAGPVEVSVAELAGIFPSQITRGSLKCSGMLVTEGPVVSLSLAGETTSLAHSRGEVAGARFKLEISKRFQKPEVPGAFATELDANDLRWDRLAADSGRVRIHGTGGQITLSELNLTRGENVLKASGEAALSGRISETPFKLEFDLKAPALERCNAEPMLTGVAGSLSGSGRLECRNGLFEGTATITGTNLRYGTFQTEKVAADVVVSQSRAELTKLHWVIDSKNQLDGSGHLLLMAPWTYDGTLSLSFEELGIFGTLLTELGRPPESLSGMLKLSWNGQGDERNHSGSGSLEVEKGRFASIRLDEARLAGTYSPEAASFSELRLVSGRSRIEGAVEVADGKLRLRDISFRQGDLEVLSGFVLLPIDLRKLTAPGSLIPADGRLAANVNATNLDLDQLFKSFGGLIPPLTGTLTASLLASGTPQDPSFNLKIDANKLTSKSLPKFPPADFDSRLHFSGNRLELEAQLEHPSLQPIAIAGNINLDLKQLLATKELPPTTPLALKVTLPSSPLGFLAELLPIIRYVEGSTRADFNVAGTVEKPQLSGSASLDMPAVRLRGETMPAISGVKAGLRLRGNELVLENCAGSVSGGLFKASGKISLPTLTTPVLDLRFSSDNVLLVRDDSLTVRADSDLAISGPFASAAVNGSIGLTNSRFFREIDILPITLPGRPAPKRRPSNTRIGVTTEPFRNWTFNVAIKTKDPFKIRGNLADGVAISDLKLVGRGDSPALEGTVRIENFTATLPFSRLEVPYGQLYFSADTPFVPVLDIHGVSVMRDYNIDMYLSGTSEEPVTLFTSEPPLPQEEILALLATGTTTEELTGNSDVLAGRASVLLFQKLYRKAFRRSEPADEEDRSFLSRFDVDVGAVDPRTGRQELSTRFRLAERFYMSGEVDLQGDVRAQIKYLFRFR